MIRVFSIQNSERLQYIAHIIFGTILGLDFEIVEVNDGFSDKLILESGEAVLLYGIPSVDILSIPNDGLLFEKDIKHQDITIREDQITKVCLSYHSSSGYSIDFDILSSAFYLISQYQEYHSNDLDEHGRYNEKSNILFLKKWHQLPLVDIYAGYIWQKLKIAYPGLKRKENAFDYKITFDIDSPYLHKNKSFLVTIGSLVKNALKLRIKDLFHQLNVLIGDDDPYDVYDEIMAKADHAKLLFFFLIDRHHPNDSRFTYKNSDYRALLKKIADSGIETGIHPSYTSYKNPNQLEFEKEQLEKIVEKPVTSSRMHFLKYSMPKTFQYLLKAGITDDYTLCPMHAPGFKNYISRPFLWFDLSTNTMTGLTLHPTMVMDRGLQKYMHLSPNDAWNEIKNMIAVTRIYNGVFTILFHNNSLSETAEWKGWKIVFDNTVRDLKGSYLP